MVSSPKQRSSVGMAVNVATSWWLKCSAWCCILVSTFKTCRGPEDPGGTAAFPLPLWLTHLAEKKMVPNPGWLVISVRVIVCDRLCTPFGSWTRSREKLWPQWWNADRLLAFRGCSGWVEWVVYVSHRVVPCHCWVKSYITAHHPCLMMSELWAALRSWEFLCPPKYSLSLIQLLQWVNLPDLFQMS